MPRLNNLRTEIWEIKPSGIDRGEIVWRMHFDISEAYGKLEIYGVFSIAKLQHRPCQQTTR